MPFQRREHVAQYMVVAEVRDPALVREAEGAEKAPKAGDAKVPAPAPEKKAGDAKDPAPEKAPKAGDAKDPAPAPEKKAPGGADPKPDPA